MNFDAGGYFQRPLREMLKTQGGAEWRRREEKRRRQEVRNSGNISLSQIASRDPLFQAYRDLRDRGGRAPGIDGIRYSDISPSEMGEICDALASSILEGSYRPQMTRTVTVPKSSGGTRNLKLGVIRDRIVARALYRAIEPVWDELFVKNSYGFRPGRSSFQMLAEFAQTMIARNQWVVASDDVKQAFDNVNLEVLERCQDESQRDLDCHHVQKVHIENSVLRLASVIAQGHETWREIGIDQGGNFSPCALNLILHYVHDLPLLAEGLRLWFRYADNLVYLVQSVTEGEQLLSEVDGRLRPAGLTLKREDGVADLMTKGSSIHVLGFEIRRSSDGQVAFHPGKRAWPHLRELLSKAHGCADPDDAAKRLTKGWITSNGPACKKRELISVRVNNLLSQYGFRELAPRTVEKWAEDAWRQWEHLYRKVSHSFQRPCP